MKLKNIGIIVIVVGLYSSCIVDDEGNSIPQVCEVQRGDVEVNRLEITFTPSSGGGPSKTFEFYDADGLGGNAPSINETWTLNYASSGSIQNYRADMRLYNDAVEVTDEIEALGDKYIVCYRNMVTNNLRLNDSNFDSNGIKLGTETTWQVLNSSSGNGNVRITVNYIHLRKEGICDAGVRIFDGTMNYQHQ